MSLRPDLAIISGWVKPESRILDLGCGDGTLLAHLRDSRQVRGYGVELSIDNVTRCVERGLSVIHADLDAGAQDFADASFDYVVMTQAIQVLQHPDRMLGEMLRIGAQGIVTFPNFGHFSTRLQFVARGRMPKTAGLPSEWYETDNIHLCTIRDFEALCRERGIRIRRRAVTDREHRRPIAMRFLPNLAAEYGIYLLEKRDD